MDIAIIARDDDFSKSIEKSLLEKLKKHDFTLNNDQPEIVIFIGGDGTFLRAVNRYLPIINQIKFVGVHTGSLGFFCEFSVDNLDELVTLISQNKPYQKHYRLLEATLTTEKSKRIYYAVNEIRIENIHRTIITDVYIDDMLLETYRGNGLLVSSQLGSTGYNKSIGGAVIESGIELMQLTEIAPLSNNIYRALDASLVLRGNRVVTFKGDGGQTILGYDHLSEDIDAEHIELKVRLGDKKVTLIHNEKRPYLSILNKAFVRS